MIKKIIQDGNNMVSIQLETKSPYPYNERHELRLIFQADGSFRLITNLPTIQVKDIMKLEGEYAQHQKVVRVESFGYPED